MMPQTTSVKPTTCSTCPNFKDFQEPNERGWCLLFDQQARKHHQQTNDCILSSDIPITHKLEDNLAFFPNINLDPFPSEVIELDRDGYPMGDETVENAYFDPNFVTSPDDPF